MAGFSDLGSWAPMNKREKTTRKGRNVWRRHFRCDPVRSRVRVRSSVPVRRRVRGYRGSLSVVDRRRRSHSGNRRQHTIIHEDQYPALVLSYSWRKRAVRRLLVVGLYSRHGHRRTAASPPALPDPYDRLAGGRFSELP